MKKVLLMSLLLLASIGAMQAKVWYVKLNGTSAWANKPVDDVLAIDADQFVGQLANNTNYSGDTLWVAGGTYQLKDIFVMKANQVLMGGFAGTENKHTDRARSDRDGNGMVEPWEFTNETILEPAAEMLARETGNMRAIVQNANSTNTAVDGLTFQNFHHRDGNTPIIFVNNDKAEFKNSVLRNSSMELDGGYIVGIIRPSAGKMSGILVEYCYAKQTGTGGVNGIFTVENKAVISESVVRGCSVTGEPNYAAAGGGFYVKSNNANGAATLINCVAHNNYASGAGGGIIMAFANDKVINSTVTKNVAGNNNGAGIAMLKGGSLYNTVAWGNRGKDGPSEDIAFMEAGANVYNVNNIAGKQRLNGTGWNSDTPQGDGQHFPGFQRWVTITQNDDGSDPNNITNKDGSDPYQYAPHFTKPSAFAGLSALARDGSLPTAEDKESITKANWSLRDNSPLIDRGSFMYVDVEADLLGRVREYGMDVDLGAYEYDPTASSGVNLVPSISFKTAIINSCIEISGIDGNFSAEMFDIAGKHVVAKQASGNISIELQNKGIFLLRITTANGSGATKVIF
ncbi:hypothetical protein MASR2M117_14630 [Paludibacter sp.]